MSLNAARKVSVMSAAELELEDRLDIAGLVGYCLSGAFEAAYREGGPTLMLASVWSASRIAHHHQTPDELAAWWNTRAAFYAPALGSRA